MNGLIKVALVHGSTRQGRFCDTVMEWLMAEMESRPEFMIETLDSQGIDLLNAAAREEIEVRMEAVDAFIVVTPEYNHGYPASLKALIDTFYEPWQRKPVAFVSYGGVSGGLRAVEQLRQVFAELQAVTVRDAVSFQSPWDHIDANGRLKASPGQRSTLKKMLDQLAWWARALRTARWEQPYGQYAADTRPGFYSVIDYTVDGPETQRQLVESFSDIQQRWVSFYPGYRSATFLASLDGTRVYNLVHWDSEADFRRFEANSDNEGRAAAIEQVLTQISGKAERRMSTAPRYAVMQKVGPSPAKLDVISAS